MEAQGQYLLQITGNWIYSHVRAILMGSDFWQHSDSAMQSPDLTHPHARSLIRTLRLKVRSEAYPWLNAAACEVNVVFNYCNETSYKAATRTDLKRKWFTGFDLCALTAGATEYFPTQE
jgi:hypothetical protein